MSESIKETKELVHFVLQLVRATDASMADGKLDIGDVTNYVTAMMSSISALDGASLIGGELRDLTEEETVELLAYVKSEFQLSSGTVETVVEAAIDIGMAVFKLIGQIRHKKTE